MQHSVKALSALKTRTDRLKATSGPNWATCALRYKAVEAKTTINTDPARCQQNAVTSTVNRVTVVPGAQRFALGKRARF